MRRFLIVLAIAFPLFATEPNPSIRQRELVTELLRLTQNGQQQAQLVDQIFAMIQKQMLDESAARGNDPDDTAEAKEMFELFRERAVLIDFEGVLRDASIQIYSKYFSEEDLTDLIAFYKTRVGRKSLEVLPHLMREGMEAGMQHLEPKLAAAMTEAQTAHAKKRPWRRTMADMRTVATGLEAYALDHEEQYPRGDYASLKDTLAEYVSDFPEKDMWDQSYAYVVSGDAKSYRLVSSGGDRNFEWDSRRVVAIAPDAEPVTRYRERLEDDLIYQDGTFLQAPVQAKPKE